VNFGKLAALKLCSLHKDDMHWILSQLTPGQRETLSTYFVELGQWDVVNGDESSAKSHQNDSRSSKEALSSLPPDIVQTAMDTLPGDLQHKVLSIAEWPWKSAVVNALGIKLSEQKALPPKLQDWLIDELLARADI
jgi:hypothetical protein